MENTETTQRLKLIIEKHDRSIPVLVSSSRSYDNSLGGIFPYHAKVSMEDGQELSGLLSRGHKHCPTIQYEFYPSFALMMNFNGAGRLGGKVLWLSESALTLLKHHEDLYDIVIVDFSQKPTWND